MVYGSTGCAGRLVIFVSGVAAVAAVIVTIVGGANCVDHVLAVARNLKSNNFKYTTNFLTEILLLENQSQLVNYRCSHIQPG